MLGGHGSLLLVLFLLKYLHLLDDLDVFGDPLDDTPQVAIVNYVHGVGFD